MNPASFSPPPAHVTLRPETPEDEPFLFEVYASTRKEELDATGWDAEARRTFLEMQFKAMRQGYRSMFPNAEFAIVLLEGISVGRAVIDRAGVPLHLVDLALLPDFRNRGVGTAVLTRLIDEAKREKRAIQLELQKGGRQQRLYERLGFRKVAETDLFEFREWKPAA